MAHGGRSPPSGVFEAHGQGGGRLLVLLVLIGALRLRRGGHGVILGLPGQTVVILLLQLLFLFLLRVPRLPAGQAQTLGAAVQVLDLWPVGTGEGVGLRPHKACARLQPALPPRLSSPPVKRACIRGHGDPRSQGSECLVGALSLRRHPPHHQWSGSRREGHLLRAWQGGASAAGLL